MGIVQARPSMAVGFRNSTKNKKAEVFDPTSPEPLVTEEDTIILRKTWSQLKDEITKVGVVFFVSLFETHPEVQDVFMSFRAMKTTELEINTIMRAHAMRVMSTVDKCIARLDSRSKLCDMMMELGLRHRSYTMKIEFIDLMGPQFIQSIKPYLETEWSAAYQRAWENLFSLMTYHMKKGMCSI